MATDVDVALAAVQSLTRVAVERAAALTSRGERIDDHQVVVDRVTYAATEARASGTVTSNTRSSC